MTSTLTEGKAIEENQRNEPAAVDQWALINRTLQVYKVAAVAVAGVAVMLAILSLCLAMANPVVVVKECGEKTFLDSKREAIKVTDEDVKAFIAAWIGSRYTWTEYEPDRLVREIAPTTTEGLISKLKEQLGKKAAQDTKEGKVQKIEESVMNIRVTLSEKDAVADFDRIVRINSIPIVVPSQVALQVVQGSATKWNRLGLYVNGVVERDEK